MNIPCSYYYMGKFYFFFIFDYIATFILTTQTFVQGIINTFMITVTIMTIMMMNMISVHAEIKSKKMEIQKRNW